MMNSQAIWTVRAGEKAAFIDGFIAQCRGERCLTAHVNGGEERDRIRSCPRSACVVSVSKRRAVQK
jgi:hypothetical protein